MLTKRNRGFEGEKPAPRARALLFPARRACAHLALPLPLCRASCHSVLLMPPEQFPRTTIVHAYLLGHKDFVSALAVVPGNGGVFLLSGGGDGMVGLWDAEAGKE